MRRFLLDVKIFQQSVTGCTTVSNRVPPSGPPQSYEHQFQADITLDRVAILLTSLAFLPNDPSPRVWRQVLLV